MKDATLLSCKADQKSQRSLLRDLREVISDLTDVNPWKGLFRFVSLSLLTVGLAILTWQANRVDLFLLGAIATGISYTFLLICNHDATHRTLTGWNWFDMLAPRVISWPMMLTIGTYNQLHHLHHGQNGIDLRDPERVQWTASEYQAAPSWQRWYVRNQWLLDAFILGSAGLVLKTFVRGWQRQDHLPKLRQQMIVDVAGILSTQAIIRVVAK